MKVAGEGIVGRGRMLGGGAVFMYWLLPHTTKFETMNVQVLTSCVICQKAVTEHEFITLIFARSVRAFISLLYLTGAAVRMLFECSMCYVIGRGAHVCGTPRFR